MTVNSNQPVSDLSSGLDYTQWGLYGQKIQEHLLLTWQEIERRWNTRRGSGRSLEEALGAALDRSGFWFERLLFLAEQLQAFSPSEFSQFWEQFRKIFHPELRPEEELTAYELMAERVRLTDTINGVRNSGAMSYWSWRFAEVSYSAFSSQEIAYLARQPGGIVEIGCGRGCLLEMVNRAGGNSIGIDPDKGILGPSEMAPWIPQLRTERRLIIGDTKKLKNHASRMMVSSWAPPGSSYPVSAFRAFRKAGGKSVCYKVGGAFIDRRNASSLGRAPSSPRVSNVVSLFPWFRPRPSHPVTNIKDLFLELLNWEEIDDPNRPAYDPRAWSNTPWYLKPRSC